MMNSQQQLLDFYRAGLSATGDMMRASFEGAERLRTQQLAAIKEALAAHVSAVAEIKDAKGIDELVAIQAKLAGTQYQTVIGYWSSVGEAAREQQLDITRRVQAQIAQIRDNVQQALGAAPAGFEPFVQALRSLVDTTSAAYALTARATEEAAKLAAEQVATANAGVRKAVEKGERKSA